jgi:hypothetical protein
LDSAFGTEALPGRDFHKPREIQAFDAKDYPVDGEDREQWDRSWRAMPHHRLTSRPKTDLRSLDALSGWGDPVSVTISQDPPQFCDRSWRESECCPICGERTSGAGRLPANLHPVWASGRTVGIGVWVHRTCFERCPNTGEPAPIPW